MGELSYMGNELSKGTDDLSKDILSAFAKAYNKSTDEWFSNAHGGAVHNQYDSSDYKRVAFKSQNDVHRFVMDMQEQGIDVVATPFKLNHQYVAEIRQQQSDGRSADEVVEEFVNRTYVDVQEQNHQVQDNSNYNANDVRQLADVLLVNHLDTLGVAIHKTQQAMDAFNLNYGQHSNTQVFHNAVDDSGNANLSINAGGAKTATVFNNDIVVMDGKIVTDEKIRDNVLSQHRERIGLANIVTGDGNAEDYSHTTKAHLNDVSISASSVFHYERSSQAAEKHKMDDISSLLNKYSDTVERYERILEQRELSSFEKSQYDKASKTLAEFEQDTGFKVVTRSAAKEHQNDTNVGVLGNDVLSKLNQDFLSRAEQAGYQLIDRHGAFDTELWKSMDEEAFKALGASETTQNIIYNINAHTRQISPVISNAEAIKDNMNRQEYAVTTTSKGMETAVNNPTLFCVWTLGDLEKLTNELNTERIASNAEFDLLSEGFSPAQKKQVDDFLTYYNEKHPEAPIEKGDLLNMNVGDVGEALNHEFEMYRIKSGLMSADFSSEEREALVKTLHTSGNKLQDLQNPEVAYRLGEEIFNNTSLSDIQFNKTEFLKNNFDEKAFLEHHAKQRVSEFQLKIDGDSAKLITHNIRALSQEDRMLIIRAFGSEKNAVEFYKLTGNVEKTNEMAARLLTLNVSSREDLQKILTLGNGLKTDKDGFYANLYKKAHNGDFLTSNNKEIVSIRNKLVGEEKARLISDERNRLILEQREQYAQKFSEKAENEFSPKSNFILNSLNNSNINDNTLVQEIKKSELFKHSTLASGALTPQKLVEMNAVFLRAAADKGYYLLNATGNIDIKLLKGLSAEQLAEIGINAKTRDVLVRVNEKGAFGAISTAEQAKLLFGKGSQALGFFVRKVDGNDGYSDVSELVGNISTATNYAQTTIATLRRMSNVRVSDLGKLARKNGLKELSEQMNKPKPKKPPHESDKKAPKTQSKQLTEKQKKKQAQAAEKQKKRLAKTEKKQNSIWGKASKAVNEGKKKIAESALGKAVSAASEAISSIASTLLTVVIAVVAVLAFLVQLIVLICVLVIALVDTIDSWDIAANWLAPDTYEDTVAYQLYEDLLKCERAWVADLEGMDDFALYECTNLKYTFDELSLDDYINVKEDEYETYNLEYIENLSHSGTNMYDTNMYINPFWRDDVVSVSENSEYLIPVSTYNGKKTFDISTNLNYYSLKNNDDAIVQTGVENGHTSNIKDIIAMTDVMYQMEANDNTDERMESYLGMSVARLNWDNFWNNVANDIKALYNAASRVWHIFDPAWQPPLELDKSISYNTIKNYAVTLFETSHQQYLYLSVSYCDDDLKVYDKSGTTVYLSNEVEIGACPAPCQHNFKVKLDHWNRPKAYLEKNGQVYFLDDDFFDITIDMEDVTPQHRQKICLWDNMETPYTTSDTIWNKIVANDCWIKAGDYSENEYLYGYGEDTDKLIENPRETAKTEVYLDILNQYNSATRETTYYVIEEDRATAYIYSYNPTPPRYSSTGATNITFDKIFDDHSDAGYWTYQYSGEYNFYTLRTVTYTRNCTGHTFEFCGGHVNVHAQGNVFSATNEQLTLTDMYKDEEAPLALYLGGSALYTDSSLTASFQNRYGEIKGKVNKSEVVYYSIGTATSTGGGVSPYEDPFQGTAVSHGLNLIEGTDSNGHGVWGIGDTYTDENGDVVGTGVQVNKSQIRYCRDIFDVDCLILKGANIFPIKDFREYEGWTADNMTLALNRIGMNWVEAYGFDVAMEIGEDNYRLSEDDIETLVAGVKTTYGANLTEKRETLLRELLYWVGRGHYSEYHRTDDENLSSDTHSFLSQVCQGRNTVITLTATGETRRFSFYGSCTTGNSLDFASYVINASSSTQSVITSGIGGEAVNGSLSSCLPADIIFHTPYIDNYNYDHKIQLDVNLTSSATSKINAIPLINYHMNEQYVFYIGTLSEDALQAMADVVWLRTGSTYYDEFVTTDASGKVTSVTLSTGQVIKAGIPICVDLTEMGAYCGVFLRADGNTTENLTTYLKRYAVNSSDVPAYSDYSYAAKSLRTTYYWLLHPDNRTRRYYGHAIN